MIPIIIIIYTMILYFFAGVLYAFGGFLISSVCLGGIWYNQKDLTNRDKAIITAMTDNP